MYIDKYLVSVIIPCYNGEAFIGKAIDSVLSQQMPDNTIEIIVVNDGSTDKSRDIVESIAKNHREIKLVNQHNQGLSAARNTGIMESKGKYILFLDADDFMSPNCIYRLCCEADSSCADMVMFDTKFAKPIDFTCITTPEFNIFYDLNPSEYLKSTRAYAMDGAVWRIIFRKSFIIQNNLRFNTNIKFSEDNHFMMAALAHCGKMIKTNTVCHNYVLHGDNMTLTTNSSDWEILVERNISRANEIMKLYLEDKRYLDIKGLKNTFEYTAYCYSFEALKSAVKAGANKRYITEVINQLSVGKTYPMKPLSVYKEYALFHRPIAYLEYTILRNASLAKTCGRLCSIINRLKHKNDA